MFRKKLFSLLLLVCMVMVALTSSAFNNNTNHINYASPFILDKNNIDEDSGTCVSGDCENGFGKMQYANGDEYEGIFFNNKRIGVATYIWADKTKYEGSWLTDTMNGFGKYYDSQGALMKESYLMQGNYIELDTSKKNFCQFGDCKNGFGTYIYKSGEIYMGNFKNGLQNGLGLFESKNGTYYGEFLNGKFNGTGFIFAATGTVNRATFVNGVQQKSDELINTDSAKSPEPKKPVRDTVINGAEFSNAGILTNINSETPMSSKDKNLIEFAQSLDKLYSYRDTKYGRLKGNMRKGKNVIYYDAIVKLKDAPGTYVRDEKGKETFLRADINKVALPKAQAIAKYEETVDNIRKILSTTWQSRPGLVTDNANAANRYYTFVNTNEPDSYIQVRVLENMVFIDMR